MFQCFGGGPCERKFEKACDGGSQGDGGGPVRRSSRRWRFTRLTGKRRGREFY